MPDLQHRWSPDERQLSRALHLAVDGAAPARPAPTAGRPEPVPVGAGRRRWALAAVPAVAACLVAAVVVGVGLATRDEPAPVADPSPAPVLQDPAVLIGTWSAEVVAQPDADITATIEEDRLGFGQRGCTTPYWSASHPDGLLLLAPAAMALVGSGPCDELGRQPWKTDVVRTAQFVVQDDDHVRLLDRYGEQVVTLTRTGTRPTSEPPVGVAALPPGVDAPTRDELLGTWFEEGRGTTSRSVWFGEDTWAHPQGEPCASRATVYALSPAGGFLQPSDPNRGCGARLFGWMRSEVSRLGLDGDVLVLFDATGEQMARFDRGEGSSGSLKDQVQGEWTPTGDADLAGSIGPLWLRVEGEWLRHAFNAACNTADDEVRLSGDGWVVGSRRAQAGGCEPGGAELVPRPIERVVLDADQLVLLDAQGGEIRRFVRADW